MSSPRNTDDWQPDVLGPDFQALTLPLGVDAEGDVVATLVRHHPRETAAIIRRLPYPRHPREAFEGWDVLYVHGWNDYFFQAHVAQWFTERGARFYALDLRKYGRSLREGQTPGLITNLDEYDRDIEAALTAMARDTSALAGRRLALFGHSTGGLVLSLWADRHPGRAQALLLNSPWLELQARAVGRQVLAPVLDLQTRVDPSFTLPSIDLGFYARTVSDEFDGEWHYNETWRRNRGFGVPSVWLSAVLAGHRRVAEGLDVQAPILTLLSSTSTLSSTWRESMRHSDCVINVEDVARRALRLGHEVTVTRVDDAVHDVFLSRRSVRDRAFAAIERWATGYAATTRP
ncbi:alpha/beta hydrolase [Pseudoclavibacter soli]|uniref:alpha/beta hydrolase n=1 Tax=Pseudoclavibacter soli TaxID=452623 RepID=UPI0004876016|nr:alpha/beta hydrolase [Pseudoclavibacter soli]